MMFSAALWAPVTHANRLFDILAVDDEFLRFHQQQALVSRDIDGLCGFHHTGHISSSHFTVFYGHHATAVDAADMAARDTGIDLGDLAVGHQFGFPQRLLDALHGGVDVDHHAALDAVAGRHAQAGQLELAARQHLGHHHHDLGGSDVQSYNEIFVLFCHMDYLLISSFVTSWALQPLPPSYSRRPSGWRSRSHAANRLTPLHWPAVHNGMSPV